MLLHGSRALDEDDKNLRFSQRINLWCQSFIAKVLFKNLPEDLLQRLHSEVYGPVLAQVEGNCHSCVTIWFLFVKVIAMHPLFGHLQGKEDFKLKSFALAAEWLNFQLF